MNKIVHVKEIPSLRVVIKNDNINIETYTLLLPHLVEEFRNKNDNYVALYCFPPFPLNDDVEKIYSDYIQKNLRNDQTKIIFDNTYEGNVISVLFGIHKLINQLNLDHKNCYFTTGATNAKKMYSMFCNEYQISNKINIICLNSWERAVVVNFKRDMIPVPVFEIKNKPKLFLCFNRVVKNHRAALLALLYNKNLVDKSYYSFFPNLAHDGFSTEWLKKDILHGMTEKLAKFTYLELEKNKSKFPLLINNIDGSNTNHVLKNDSDFYKNSYFSVVTETFFFRINRPHNHNDMKLDEFSVFFSEKTFKPIVCKHPFIIVSRPKMLFYLKKLGYKTFHPHIDESYDEIEDDEQRLLAIVNEIERLSKKNSIQWIEFLLNVKPIVEHNFNHIMNKKIDDFQYIGD